MRALLKRITLLAASVVTLLVVALDSWAQVPPALLFWRAGLTFGIVTAAGFAVGWILMRTVLRRRYEEWQLTQPPPRARADR